MLCSSRGWIDTCTCAWIYTSVNLTKKKKERKKENRKSNNQHCSARKSDLELFIFLFFFSLHPFRAETKRNFFLSARFFFWFLCSFYMPASTGAASSIPFDSAFPPFFFQCCANVNEYREKHQPSDCCRSNITLTLANECAKSLKQFDGRPDSALRVNEHTCVFCCCLNSLFLLRFLSGAYASLLLTTYILFSHYVCMHTSTHPTGTFFFLILA